VDQRALEEYRYRAVLEVLGGSPIGEVAARYGTSRQSVHRWQRFAQEGRPGLADRSRRPKTSPTRLAAELEALVCQLRRQHPRWGARRISHELGKAGHRPVPSRAATGQAAQASWKVGLVGPPPAEPAGGGSVELEVRVPPSGEVTLVAGSRQIPLPQGLAGRTLTIWADLRSVHLTLDGHLVRTLGSRLLP
jgi:transposase